MAKKIVYSLKDYQIVVTFPQSLIQAVGGSKESISIGGSNKYVGSISVSRSKERYSFNSDDSGGYYFSESNDISGTVEVSMTMVSPQCFELQQLLNLYEAKNIRECLTITVMAGSEVFAKGEDCMITSKPGFQFSGTPGDISWTFTCGVLNY